MSERWKERGANVFRLPLRKILTLFGLLMMIFVVVNVQFGSVAPQVIDGAEGYKLDAFLMFEPSCTFELVEEELKETGTSYCLGEVGQWSGADVLMLMEGLFLFVYGFELPQNKGLGSPTSKVGLHHGLRSLFTRLPRPIFIAAHLRKAPKV